MYAVYIQTFDQTLDTINRNYDSNPKFKAIMDEIHVSLKYDFVILALYVPSHYAGMINTLTHLPLTHLLIGDARMWKLKVTKSFIGVNTARTPL